MDMIDLDNQVVTAGNLSCILCKNEKFKTNKHLLKHLLNLHKQSSTICRFCQRYFFFKRDYITHVGKHTNANSHVYRCSICPQSFFSKTFLLEHQNKHSSLSNYVDGFVHKTKKAVDNTVKRRGEYKKKNVKMDLVKCKESLLIITNRSTEDQDPLMDGSDSSMVVKDKLMECLEGIVEHPETAKSGVDTSTHITKRYFEDGTEMNVLDMTPNKSHWAPQITANKVSVSETLDEISKTKPSLNMLVCEECDQLFSNEFFLARHLATHTKRNLKYKYMCKYCRMRYCAPNRLFAHFGKFHKSETPFSCEMCHVTFVKKSDFSSHIQSQHADDGIIKFLQDGLIVYTCKSKNSADTTSKIDVDTLKSDAVRENLVAEGSDLGQGKSKVLSGESSQGRGDELRHWKGGLLKHWEGDSDDHLSPQKGDSLSTEKSDEQSPGGDDMGPEKGDGLSPGKGDSLSPGKGDKLNPGKGDKLNLGGDEMRPENGEDKSLRTSDEVASSKDDEECSSDKGNPGNGDVVSSEKGSDMSIELGNALGLVKVSSSKNGEELSQETVIKFNPESPIKTKSKRLRKKTKYSIEASDTDESSWDGEDEEPLSVIRKSKRFKMENEPKKQLFERCDICDVKLRVNSMKKHKQRHSNNSRFKCHLCKLSVKEEFKFHIHMKTHFQNDKFLCICGVRLPNKQLLDEHKKKVHWKDNQMPNLTMIRSVSSPITDGKQSSLQSSQVLVKKLNEKPRVFNVKSSQGKVEDAIKSLISKVDPRAFGSTVKPSLFKERVLNFGNANSPIGEKKKMNFTIKVITPQEAEERNKILIKPIPAADVKMAKPAPFRIQQTAMPKPQDGASRNVKRIDGIDLKLSSLSPPNIGKTKQAGKRKYLKVNMQELIKSAGPQPLIRCVRELQLVTANPLAHLMGNSPISEPSKTNRKSKNFDYESIIQKSLLDQMQ